MKQVFLLLLAVTLSLSACQNKADSDNEILFRKIAQDELFLKYQNQVVQLTADVLSGHFDFVGIKTILKDNPRTDTDMCSEESTQRFTQVKGGVEYLQRLCLNNQLLRDLATKYSDQINLSFEDLAQIEQIHKENTDADRPIKEAFMKQIKNK